MNSLQALKEQTLQELLEAYVKIAKDRILQALANERAKRDGRDKKSGSEIISFRGDRSKNIIESTRVWRVLVKHKSKKAIGIIIHGIFWSNNLLRCFFRCCNDL